MERWDCKCFICVVSVYLKSENVFEKRMLATFCLINVISGILIVWNELVSIFTETRRQCILPILLPISGDSLYFIFLSELFMLIIIPFDPWLVWPFVDAIDFQRRACRQIYTSTDANISSMCFLIVYHTVGMVSG